MAYLKGHGRHLVALDDRYLPILISTFHGDAGLDFVRSYDEACSEVLQTARARGTRVVHIVDARTADVPAATVRQYWASRIRESGELLREHLGTFVVIGNSLQRGALTAIAWMAGDSHQMEYCPTMNEAFARAGQRLALLGHHNVTLSAETYQVPRLSKPPSMQAQKAQSR